MKSPHDSFNSFWIYSENCFVSIWIMLNDSLRRENINSILMFDNGLLFFLRSFAANDAVFMLLDSYSPLCALMGYQVYIFLVYVACQCLGLINLQLDNRMQIWNGIPFVFIMLDYNLNICSLVFGMEKNWIAFWKP